MRVGIGGLRREVPMLRIAALAAVSLLCFSPALAWGGLGHEAVCELAFQELDDTARQRVAQLIALDERYDTFRASCNWPDRPEQRARHSPQHTPPPPPAPPFQIFHLCARLFCLQPAHRSANPRPLRRA